METASFLNESRFLACQCCHSNLSLFETPIQVTVEIKRRFFELTQVEMKTSSQSVICLACDGKLFEFSEFRCEVLRLMSESIFVKTETEAVVKVEYESEDYDALDQPMVEEYLIDKEEPIVKKTSKTKQPKTFSCEICPEKNWNSRRSLERHMLTVHGKAMTKEKFPFENLCTVCAKLIRGGRCRFEEHMLRFHSDDFKYFCDLCPRKSKQLKEIRRHIYSHIQKEFREKFPCESCGLNFSAKRRLDMHVFMKHADHPRIFNCDCGKSFKTQAHLTHHIREMHNLGSFPCEECESRVFPTKSKLDRHLREFHAEKKPCQVCGKLLSGARTMAKHMIGHGDPEFKCTFEGCTKKFFGKIALMDHIATKHERNESFICPTCGSTFATLKNMKKHIQRQHTAVKISCGVESCKHTCTRKDYLARHYRAHKDIDEGTRSKLIAAIKDIQGIAW